jgi:hypothetical protein
MHKDTGHRIYTGSGCQCGEPYVLFGGSSMEPCAWCWVGSDQVPGYVLNPPLCSPGGGFLVGYKAGVLVGLHGTSPTRIIGEF